MVVDMHPEPVMRPMSGWPLAMRQVRSASATTSVAPVTATEQPRSRASARATSAMSSEAEMDSTPRISAAAPARNATSAALPRTTATSTSSRMRRAESLRRVVAPAPTGSSTTGTPARLAALPARTIESTRSGHSVPMFRTTAPAIEANSSTSPGACAMTGSAPSARIALAVSFITTKFVMLCMSGLVSRMRVRSAAADVASVICGPPRVLEANKKDRLAKKNGPTSTFPCAGITQRRSRAVQVRTVEG